MFTPVIKAFYADIGKKLIHLSKRKCPRPDATEMVMTILG